MWREAMLLAVVAMLMCMPARAADDYGDVASEPAALRAEELRPYDRRGIARDTAYFVGYQLAMAAVIALSPDYDTDDPRKDWWHNVKHPVWDTDTFAINYVLHPYWGAAYYVRARERGLSRANAFWYSALLSTIFEYSAEAMVENVSIQDMLFTPTLGWLLGEYVFWPMRERILAKSGPLDRSDRITLVLTDPLRTMNSAVDRVFGVKSEMAMGPMVLGTASGHRFSAGAGTIRTRMRVDWGVQVRVEW